MAEPPWLIAARAALKERGPAPPPAPAARPPRAAADTTLKDEQEAWLMSYLDMLTVLLTFLVVTLALSELKRPPPGMADVLVSVPADAPAATPAPPRDQVAREDGFGARLRAALGLAGLAGRVDLDTEQGNLQLRLSNEVLFARGQADLNGEGQLILAEVAKLLIATGRPISIEGHTDNVPIATERFPSNWSLSAARAVAVVQFLGTHGVSGDRLRAVGYADTHPIAGNDTEEGRARNRRVTIVIHSEGAF